ncbi:class I SAM-dependent methyltransferase [Mycobacterium avium subsp. hominissuis]|uniref:Class I SAM-dependent methyltransferase n=2 Tax=Mycobacterium avium TaxID=1764 RepID=A0A3B6X469_MYCAV|nr:MULTISPECIES: class I SAM-dependent methyltransferase [Mycobacterium avium complex (MAC)]AXO21901.1 class I SAM-dependent methyltransferase [Mycobacterium avium subsp. hominissuis]ETZ47881.1 methyltransferase domain protein [Mycobacterium avium MAV_120809_2495]ETZ54138.1 methyltransferase domain protein [Mycobacterium sp. MAC_011194_8550]ETZ64575.1 methyltransferase domain protein [Mycobacterium sp. MAC_080597_8934]MBG0728707.1 class I SAM-dependent methyltransferase [Mycobacterium avium]
MRFRNVLFPYVYRFGQPVFDRLFYQRYRRQAMSHATGRLLMVGLGPGTDLMFLPAAVTSVAAVEPEASFRRMAARLAARQGVAVDVVAGSGESIPFPDNSFDSVHIGLVLCSVRDVGATLAEIRRVLVPGGRLVVLEHVRGDGLTGRLQDLIARPWSWLAGGCEPNRRTGAAIAAAGFDTSTLRSVPRTPVPFPCKPHLQGFAVLSPR